jgi:hypothetical protein
VNLQRQCKSLPSVSVSTGDRLDEVPTGGLRGPRSRVVIMRQSRLEVQRMGEAHAEEPSTAGLTCEKL